ncbi:MAG: OmpA family protein [Rubrivivax sp.]
MNKPHVLSTLAAAALLAACATQGPAPQALVDARQVVQSAERDPKVLEFAALELKRATDSLARAEALQRDRGPVLDIESTAYVARREAETAITLAEAKRAEAAIQAARVERERLRADARSAEADKARQAAAAASAAAALARDQASAALTDAERAQRQAAVAQVQMSDAEARARAAQEAASQARVTALSLQQQLIELQARPTQRGTLVTLGDVLFESGRADIKPNAGGALDKLAAWLKEHGERRVLIEGFTDSVGSEDFNLVLSQRRAQAVSAALAARGVAPGRIDVRGYGESYPVADNTSATNRALNRRVEVYISDDERPVRARS